MLKWIRPSGALAFIVVILAIGLFWWLLSDWLLKVSIEAAGSKIVGARVELASADVTFNPLGFQLDGLQVTNPKQPMQNLIQLENAKGSLDLLHLLMGQVIVEEMSATGVRLNTERKVSGEIKEKKSKHKDQQKSGDQAGEKEPERSTLAVVKEKLPSLDEILAKEPLGTLDQIKTFDEKSKSDRVTFEKSVATLPDEAKLKQHQESIKTLTQSKINSPQELKQRKQDLDKLKVAIRKDRDAIQTMRDQLKNARSDLAKRYNDLKNAPSEDWNRLKSRYQLNASGAGNVTRMLFGDSAQVWLTRVLAWAEQAQKFMPRGGDKDSKATAPKRREGRQIHFPTSNPLPDFLIRKAVLTMEVPAGAFDLQLTNVTHQPHIFGKPMRLFAQGTKLRNAEQIKIDGVFDHVKPEQAKDSINWLLNGVSITNIPVSKNAKLPIEISSTRANFSGDLILKDQAIDANAKSEFKDTTWNTNKGEGSESKLAKLVTAIHDFNINGKLTGKLSAPDISLNSNIEDQLKQALGAEVKATQSDLEKKFKARLNKEIETAAGQYKDQLAFLTDKGKTLDQRIDALNKMLTTEIKSAAETKKQEARDKLKDSAKEKLKGLKF